MYGVLFLLVGGVFAFWANRIGGAGWLLFWPATSFMLVGLGYLGLGARVFGKRGDGTLGMVALIVLAPFLLYTRVMWHMLRLVRREPACNEVAPGLYVGRWPRPGDLPPEVAIVVDMTAEFSPARGVCEGRRYVCLPTLDGSVPSLRHLARLVDEIAAADGPIYAHCAEGHGRSGMLATALVLRRGIAKSVDEAIDGLRAARPGIRLAAAQRALVAQLQERGTGER
jgi:protein-tyrosine phosphatase